ncbi:MAG: flavin reductase family protein [Bryobacteraceae bacterium]|nr:flavin reductase family protein [Bryobacteraceae bacterium]
MSEDLRPDVFRRTCARFATGIAVATTIGTDGLPYGLTVNSFTSVSCSPPIVLFCIDHGCSYLFQFREAAGFGINFLNSDQCGLSARFATGPGDRFSGVAWETGSLGMPLLEGCLASMECKVTQRLDVGDHAVLFGEVIAASVRPGEPLLYFDSQYRSLQPGLAVR